MVLGIDVGGTFTDAALLTDGGLVTAKAPTTPADQSQGVMDAIHAALGQSGSEPRGVRRLVHGMTVGTNALLEGRVARTALLATEGFTDLEELGRQARRELYRLCAGHPPPLVPPERRVGVPERTGPDGILRALDEGELWRRLEKLDDGVEAAAVCLLWGFLHPEHERRVERTLAEVRPNAHVSTSHGTTAVFREYERCATTVVDAALSPVLRRYLERLAERTREAGLPDPEVMLSGGGVVDAAMAARHGSWTVLSGPAGGAVGAARAAQRAGAAGAVCLDMGGTSCDVCVSREGRVEQAGGREVGGRALALPMVDVHTVGAGGGSVAWRDAGGALRVGPRSAGADPGPACYGRGGDQPTVTDAHLLLGHLDSGAALAGDVALDREAAAAALRSLGETLGLSEEETAMGVVEVAGAEMAQAVRVVTVERGIDPRDLALVAFGGAGPLHATAIAERLDMGRVLVPRSAGVLSALGLVESERRRDLVASVMLAGDRITRESVERVVRRLAERGRRELSAPGAELRPSFDLRYRGQAFELTVPGSERPSPDELRAALDAAHRDRYGYADTAAELELVTIRLAVAEPAIDSPPSDDHGNVERGSRTVVFGDRALEAAVLSGPIDRVEGPAICHLPSATLLVPPGWHGRADAHGTLVLERE